MYSTKYREKYKEITMPKRTIIQNIIRNNQYIRATGIQGYLKSLPSVFFLDLGHRGRDRKVFGSTTIYAIGAYHH